MHGWIFERKLSIINEQSKAMGISGQLRTMEHDDGAAVLNIQTGHISTLNQTGAYIWNAMQRGEPTEMIAENLARETGEDIAVVKNGIAAFLEDLSKHRLLAF
ncbi:PqqD family protein [Silvibacterium sp.]|uniref:PqqD family protein n=1 Tax=Silvibacterium sp. TaxID=1964179 RepID=UPI0039E430D6